jgi:hypothetical protein
MRIMEAGIGACFDLCSHYYLGIADLRQDKVTREQLAEMWLYAGDHSRCLPFLDLCNQNV